MPKCRKSVNFGLQLGPRGGKPHLPFGIIFVHGAPLGARMGPRPLPRASGTPPDLNFKRILVDVHRFFDNFGWFPARFFHRFSMVELGWERVPYSTGWEGAVADLGGNASHESWVGRCKPRHGGRAGPQGSWINKQTNKQIDRQTNRPTN